jgi:hypothetical protein
MVAGRSVLNVTRSALKDRSVLNGTLSWISGAPLTDRANQLSTQISAMTLVVPQGLGTRLS